LGSFRNFRLRFSLLLSFTRIPALSFHQGLPGQIHSQPSLPPVSGSRDSNIMCFAIDPSEDHPPLIVDSDRVKILQVTTVNPVQRGLSFYQLGIRSGGNGFLRVAT
jgi:hypothetical protein